MEEYLRGYAMGLATTPEQRRIMRLRVLLLDGSIRCPYCPGTRTTRRNRIASSQSFGRHIGWCHVGLLPEWNAIRDRVRRLQRSWRVHGYIRSEQLLRAWKELDG
jgi:hypothetical protein